jgi:uncharacterized membrane protein
MIVQFWLNKSISKPLKKTQNYSEKPIRSLVKAISWRLVGTVDTLIISWLITGQWALALSISAVEMITKMVLYYGHERIWNTIKWQKNDK